jgi:energy-coupling factor transport system ATP-binding protein
MLETRDLTVRYWNRSKPAVSHLTLDIAAGEFVLLTGDSASGKSTVMQAVCGFIPHIVPAEVHGTVAIDGRTYEDPLDIARTICMVQQDPETQFCTETVEEEVAFGPENFRHPPGEIRHMVEDALRSVRADHLIDRRLLTLSGGEKQKVAIASVLVLKPRLLILDEPTSSLDPQSVSEVVDAIRALKDLGDITTVVVEHRIGGFADIATRIVKIDEGRLAGDEKRGTEGFDRLCEEAMSPAIYPSMKARGGRVIEVEGLSYAIGGKQILDDVSLTVEEGAVVALMGENGAGKTTLLRHLAGLAAPQKGRIRILDHRISAGATVDPWVLGTDVGMVFQNPNHQLFESSVERELLFASGNFGVAPDEAANAALAFESAEGVSQHVHPHCLSLGQRRRVNILSSSSHGPRVLLMDEPFVGQDRTNSLKIAQLVAGLQGKGRTVVIVTHDPSFARAFCTHAVVLQNGKVADAGPAAAVVDRQGGRLFGGRGA